MSKVNKVTEEELDQLPKNLQVDFGLFCAKQSFHLIPEKYKPLCQEALDTAERWLEGKASEKECREIANRVWEISSNNYAAVYAVSCAAYAAYNATYDAYDASYYSLEALKNSEEAIREQREYFNSLVDLANIDKIFEEVVLL